LFIRGENIFRLKGFYNIGFTFPSPFDKESFLILNDPKTSIPTNQHPKHKTGWDMVYQKVRKPGKKHPAFNFWFIFGLKVLPFLLIL